MSKEILSISVVIPTFNRAELVVRALNSIFLQHTFAPLEIIVLDDASTDNTQYVLNELKVNAPVPMFVYRSEINIGPSKLRNKGIDLAKGNYIAFLDSDDVWTENKLSVFAKELRTFPELAIWTHRYGQYGENEFLSTISEVIPYWKQLLKNHASCPCTIIRKDVNEKFSENLKYNEDHELFTRISFSHDLIFNQSVLTILNRRINEKGGLSGNVWQMRKGEMKSYLLVSSYNKILIPMLPFLILFSLLKHVRLMLRLR